MIVNPAEKATFVVIYKPNAAQRSQANLKVTVTDNQYEDSVVQMVGEAYEDDITLDNIGSVFVPIDPEKEVGNMADDDVGGKGKLDVHQWIVKYFLFLLAEDISIYLKWSISGSFLVMII